MKKSIIVICLAIMALTLSACQPVIHKETWMTDYQQAIDYINSDEFSLADGKVTFWRYLMSGHDEMMGDYIKFVIEINGSEKRIMDVYVKWKVHLTQKGPEFQVDAIHFSHRTSWLEGEYRCPEDGITITMTRDWHFSITSDEPGKKAVSGSGYYEDSWTVILNDFENKWRFLADDVVMVYLPQEADGFPFAFSGDYPVFYNTQASKE
ncbi:MAG: hypothetical protein IJM79_04405 [Erysipelotrichaceae bacterium]|nr:hypothetical protein [Erysipelotrichaceae bacterium]